MAPKARKKRADFTREEKEDFAKKMKRTSTNEDLNILVREWNIDPEHKDRNIRLASLQNIRDSLPQIRNGEQFWASVEAEVMAKVQAAGTNTHSHEPFHGTAVIKHLNVDKIPEISQEQLQSLVFDFSKPIYHREDLQGTYVSSNKRLHSDFRDHWDGKGLVYGPFEDIMSRDEKQLLEGKTWVPARDRGPWPVVARAIAEKGIEIHKALGATFSDHTDVGDGRINPSLEYLLKLFPASQPPDSVNASLMDVLNVGQALYRSVGDLLMTDAREDSKRQKYAFNQGMQPSEQTFLSCLPKSAKQIKRHTIVQLEHMDDGLHNGAGGLWGLVERQYVVVWLFSYEMNLELESIWQFRDSVMSNTPADWSEDAFWNLVAAVHLRNMGFAGDKRPTPVKIPLDVGKLLLFDFKVLHAGMPSVGDSASMRGHMYWAQNDSRRGQNVSDHTFFVWETTKAFYPGWRFIADTRNAFL